MSAEVARGRRARRQLTADIAHDLNTPLSVISGTLEGMLDGTFAPTRERHVRLQRETAQVARLVSDLRSCPSPTRVTQVLQNLLGNALAHTPGRGSVAVKAGVVGPVFRVTGRDSGTGIAPEQLPHVFDRLYRADRGDTRWPDRH